MIPDFGDRGYLPQGIHLTNGQDFLDRFLFNDYRKDFAGAIVNILDWAKHHNAEALFVGGSFVTNMPEPSDLDVLIVFSRADAIPHKSEVITIASTRIDIQFCDSEQRPLVDAFVNLLSRTRSSDDVGVVQIELFDRQKPWKVMFEPDDFHFEIVRRAYIQRHYVDHLEPNGIIVTIHGIRTNASWNAEIAPIVSSQNWVFAPFLYTDHNSADITVDRSKSSNIVDDFRTWLYDLSEKYPFPVSVIAHSFGTYILASYLNGFGERLPVSFNSIILTGSIIATSFPWDNWRDKGVGRVLNEIAPNDGVVKHVPKLDWLVKEPLYGTSGIDGFSAKSDILFQRTTAIFNHNNVIRRDIIEQHWMPFLMGTRSALTVDFRKKTWRDNAATRRT